MKTAAFITYNELGRGTVASGWHEQGAHRALVLQNTRGEGTLRGGQISSAKRAEQVDLLWQTLRQELPSVDHLVVYVGANGSQNAIKFAAEVSPEKVTFVACDCGLEAKEQMICSAGLGNAGRVLCECGGHSTMKTLYELFMATGALNPWAH